MTMVYRRTTTIINICALSVLATFVLLSFSPCVQAGENDSEFESDFLRRDKNGASPDIFLYKNAIAPGVRRVEVVVNDRLADVYDVRFVPDTQSGLVVPCLNRRLLTDAGVKTGLYDGWQTSMKDGILPTKPDTGPAVCDSLEQRIPAARVFYDDAHQQLRLTLPQEAVETLRFQMISLKSGTTERPPCGRPTMATSTIPVRSIRAATTVVGILTITPSSASPAQPVPVPGAFTALTPLTKALTRAGRPTMTACMPNAVLPPCRPSSRPEISTPTVPVTSWGLFLCAASPCVPMNA